MVENPGSTGRQTWSRSGSQSGSAHKGESVSSMTQQQQSNAATSQWVAEQNAVSTTTLYLISIKYSETSFGRSPFQNTGQFCMTVSLFN